MRNTSKKVWVKPEIKAMAAGSAEASNQAGNDGQTPAPTAS
jgi:hypothetical protein